MTSSTRWMSSLLLAFAVGGLPALTVRADTSSEDCEPADHPPDPEAVFDHTKLAHLTEMVGSYGFDLPGAVYALAISPGNARILAGGASRTALLWHPKAGRSLRETDVMDRDVTAVGFSPDSRVGLIGMGLSGSEGYPIYAWDLITGNRVQVFNGHTWDVTSVQYSHDGALVLSSSRDGTVKVWDAKSGQVKRSFQHPWQVLAATFSPDDKLILSANRDGQLFLWSTDEGEKVRTFDGLRGPVRSIAFSEDGTHVLAASDFGLVEEWDTNTGKSTRLMGLAIGTFNGMPARFGQLARVPDQTAMQPISAHLALSGNGEHFGAALPDGTLMTWNLQTLKVEDPLQAPPRTEWAGGRLALSDDGTMAVEGFTDGRVRLRDLEHHEEVVTGRHVDGGLEKLATSANAQRFFGLNATTHELMLLDAQLNVLKSYNQAGEGRFEPTNKLALIALTDERTGKSIVKVVDTASGAVQRQLVDSIYLETFAFSNDSRQAIVIYTLDRQSDATKSYVSIWDLRNGRKVKEITVRHVGETMLTRDEKYALTSSAQGGLVLWELSNGKVRHTIGSAGGRQRPLALSPDGKLVATASPDKIITLWSIDSGDLLRSLKGHRCQVQTAAFTPDSKRLVSIGGADEELRLWDGATSEQVDAVDLISHNDHPVSATFSDNGQSLLIGTGRGVVMRFDFNSAEASANSGEDELPPPDDNQK